jgi:uroporphyrinogen-III decarboxylase
MNSRERVRKAINHKEADRIPLDLGSTLVTGIEASIYAKLRNVLGISKGLIKVYDPFQMLAEVEDEVKQLLGVDTYGIQLPVTIFGYKNENWKKFKMFDGTNILISGNFEYDVLKNGGFVFNTVHNIQATVPVDNLITMFKTVLEKGSYDYLEKRSLKK